MFMLHTVRSTSVAYAEVRKVGKKKGVKEMFIETRGGECWENNGGYVQK